MAHALNLQPNTTVSDVGCGIGGPAKEIATFANCKVVGVTNNGYQIQKGREISQKEGVHENVLELVMGDFLVSRKLPSLI